MEKLNGQSKDLTRLLIRCNRRIFAFDTYDKRVKIGGLCSRFRSYDLKAILVALCYFCQLFFRTDVFAQQPVFWWAHPSTTVTAGDRLFGIKTTSDSGQVVCGSGGKILFAGSGPTSGLVIGKFSKYGNLQWRKLYFDTAGAINGAGLNDIELSSGGYLAGGGIYHLPTYSVNSIPFLMRTDLNGNIQWAKSYNFLMVNPTSLMDLVNVGNGDLIFSSWTQATTTHPIAYGYLTKTDSQGNLIWSKRIWPGNSLWVRCWKLKKLADGNLLLIGDYAGSNPMQSSYFVLKFDTAGNTIWFKEYSIPNYSGFGTETVTSLDETPSGDIVISFWIASSGTNFPTDPPWGREGPYVLKLNSAGNVKFCKDYGKLFGGGCAAKYLAGNNTLTFFMGFIDTVVNNFNRGLFFTVDSIGRVLVSKAYDNLSWNNEAYSGDCGGGSLDSTAYGGFVSCGFHINSFNDEEGSLVSIDGLGFSGGCFEDDICIKPRCVTVQAINISGTIPYAPVVNSHTFLVDTETTGTVVCAGTSTVSKAIVNQILAGIYPAIEQNLIPQSSYSIAACGGSVTVTANYPVCRIDSLVWSTGSVNQHSIVVNSPGTYWAGVYDCATNTIVMKDYFVVTGLPIYQTKTVNATICQGQVYTFPSGALASVAGTYIDTLFASSSCDTIFTVFLAVKPGFTLNFSPTNSITCFQPTTTLSVAASATGLGYNWQPNGIGGQTLIVNTPGIYTVTAFYNAQPTCSQNGTVLIMQNISQPTVSFSPPVYHNCSNNSVQIQANVSPSNVSITWLGGGTGTTKTVSAPGNYTVVAINLVNGCSLTAVQHVNPIKTFNFTLVKKDVCFGGQTGSAEVMVSNGVGPYSYLWSNNQGGSTVNGLGIGIHSVSITDKGTGCSQMGTVVIVQSPQITATIQSSANKICAGDKVVLTALSNQKVSYVKYSWSTGSEFNPVDLTLMQNSIVSLTVANSNGCASTFSASIDVLPLPKVDFKASTEKGCEPLCVSFTSTDNATSWKWYFDTIVVSGVNNSSFCYQKAGSYNVALKIAGVNGCSNVISKPNFIQVFSKPQASFSIVTNPISILEPTVELVNVSSNASSFLWDFGDTPKLHFGANPSHVYENAGAFHIVLVAGNNWGCYDTTVATVYVEVGFNVYIPNAFSPNDNNLNEDWGPHGTGISDKEYELSVFDRWGEQIFRSTSFFERWDGTYRSQPVKEDVYVYKLQVMSERERKIYHFSGHVILLR
jgi:gliding motility-associated-like protein